MKRLQMILLLLLFNCASGPVGGLVFSNYEYAGEVNPDSSIPILAEAKVSLRYLDYFQLGIQVRVK